MLTLFTTGYNAWKADQRMQQMGHALKDAAVTLLVDVRHFPCASDYLGKTKTYGPKPWSLEAKGGIVTELSAFHIDFVWVPELGNPQKNDKAMTILKTQLADAQGRWPIHRGLDLLQQFVEGGSVCCLMCGCEQYHKCHRQLVAEAWGKRYGACYAIVNLGARGTEKVFEGGEV